MLNNVLDGKQLTDQMAYVNEKSIMKNLLPIIIFAAQSWCIEKQLSISLEPGVSTAFTHFGIETIYQQQNIISFARIYSEYRYHAYYYGEWVEANLDFVEYYKSYSRYQIGIGYQHIILKRFKYDIIPGIEYLDAYESNVEIDTSQIYVDNYSSANRKLYGFILTGISFADRLFLKYKINMEFYGDYIIGYRTKSFPFYFYSTFERNYIGLNRNEYSHCITGKLVYNIFRNNEEHSSLLPSGGGLPFLQKILLPFKHIDKLICLDIFCIGLLCGMAGLL